MKVIRWIACFDSHGEHIDQNARRAFLEFSKHWKPSLRIHGGDFMDLTALRRGATDEERDQGVKNDIEMGIEFIRDMKANVILWGNHDRRIERAIKQGSGRLREYSLLLYNSIMDRLGGIEHIPYGKRRGIYKLGNWRLLHGYHSGIYAARQAAAVYGNCFMGHVHCNSIFDSPAISGATGVTVGCMCDLDLEYTESQPGTLRWSHGFLYGLLYPTGSVMYWLARKVDDKWVLPSEVKTL